MDVRVLVKLKKGILYNEPKARKLGSQLQNGIRF